LKGIETATLPEYLMLKLDPIVEQHRVEQSIPFLELDEFGKQPHPATPSVPELLISWFAPSHACSYRSAARQATSASATSQLPMSLIS
jgi:hypothetical protein